MLFILTADIKSCEIQQVVWGSLHACDFGLCLMHYVIATYGIRVVVK